MSTCLCFLSSSLAEMEVLFPGRELNINRHMILHLVEALQVYFLLLPVVMVIHTYTAKHLWLPGTNILISIV